MTAQVINTNKDFLEREAAEDIFYGQVVINWARWFIIAAGVAMVMIVAETPAELTAGIAPIVGLMVVNFYLHGRRLADKPANRNLVSVSSLLDLTLITAVIAVSREVTGLDNQFYVAYFPVIAAFSFVMSRKSSILYTGLAMVAYSVVCLTANTQILEVTTIDGSFAERINLNLTNLESLMTRLIVMGAVGGLASYFWRVQRDRRRVDAA
jgi:hypothetical protein